MNNPNNNQFQPSYGTYVYPSPVPSRYPYYYPPVPFV